MNNPDETWSRTQLDTNLSVLDQYLTHPCFKRGAIFTDLTQSLFVKLVLLEDKLLEQAEKAGHRIDFLDEVGTNGRIEDVTSLLHNCQPLLYNFDAASGRKANPEGLTILAIDLNHFYGSGVGHFANGLFFRCDHDDELAFFVGRNRILFYRHLVRAFNEAKAYLLSNLS